MKTKLIVALLLLLSATGYGQTASVLIVNPDSSLHWNSGGHNTYVRGDGYLDTRIIACSGVSGKDSGTTALTVVYVDSIDANKLTINSVIRISGLWKCTGNNGARLPGVLIDSVATGTTGFSMSLASTFASSSNTQPINVMIGNLNADRSQAAFVGGTFNGGTTQPATATLTITKKIFIKFVNTNGSAIDKDELLWHLIEVINP